MGQGIFITGTDTDVGKTVASAVLGILLQDAGYDVGIMKPVQCGGGDASFLVNALDVRDEFDLVNPYYAKDSLSPHLAFERAKQKIDPKRIMKAYQELSKNHDVTLVEGAGGLMVPLTKNYLVVDLIRDMNLDVVIVSRLGLGTINHTLMTIAQVKDFGINVRGVVFSKTDAKKEGLAQKDNPKIIEKISGVPVLGVIPYLKNVNRSTILKKCKKAVKIAKIHASVGTKQTKTLKRDDQKYVWHPFTQMSDWQSEDALVIDRARGNYLFDTDGNQYLDGVSSLWVNVHGHGHKTIDRAVKDQTNQLSHSTLLGLANAPSIELAKRLVEITPEGLDKVFYSDSGSTSVEIAIKLAYQYWQNKGMDQKRRIVHLENSYHGDTLGSVSVGGIDLFHKVYRHLIFEAVKVEFPNFYRSSKKHVDECLQKMEDLFAQKHENLAALVVEPLVQGAAGMIMWPKGILKRMEELCRRYDVFLIADEVATGFGRTGKMFACEHENVTPDFMCLAKGITGGYLPLAATLASQKVYDGFLYPYKDLKTFFHGHTYTGNPLACAAALASLQVFKEEKTIKNLKPKIKHLQEGLKAFYNLAAVGDVRQRGMMVGIELVKNKETKEPFAFKEKVGARVCQKVRERGIILRPLGNVIVFMPPLSITKEEIDYLLETTYWAIREVGAIYESPVQEI